MCTWRFPPKVCAWWALEGRLLAPWWWWSRRVCTWRWQRHQLSASCNWGILIKAELTGRCRGRLALLWRWAQRAGTEVAAVVIPFTAKRKQNDREFKISENKLSREMLTCAFPGTQWKTWLQAGRQSRRTYGWQRGGLGVRSSWREWSHPGQSLCEELGVELGWQLDWSLCYILDLGTWRYSAGFAAREVKRGLSVALRARAGHLKHTSSLTAEKSTINNNPLKLNRNNILVGQVSADDSKDLLIIRAKSTIYNHTNYNYQKLFSAILFTKSE